LDPTLFGIGKIILLKCKQVKNKNRENKNRENKNRENKNRENKNKENNTIIDAAKDKNILPYFS
jgi:hypothetical protein